jgi:hypothetical protein
MMDIIRMRRSRPGLEFRVGGEGGQWRRWGLYQCHATRWVVRQKGLPLTVRDIFLNLALGGLTALSTIAPNDSGTGW